MTIDGRNISEWGLRVADGTLSEWLKLPKRKTVAYNNWAEFHGIDPDLIKVEWEETSYKLSFIIIGMNPAEYMSRFRAFLSFLSGKEARVVSYMGITRSLRYDQGNSYNGTPVLEQRKSWAILSLTMKEEEPEIKELYPISNVATGGKYAINGMDLAEFGIGGESKDEDIWKYTGMKAPFTDGKTYDLSSLSAKHKEIKLDLWWICDNMSNFVNNRMALLWQLSRPGMLNLYADTIGGSTNAYYTGCNNLNVIYTGGRVAATLSLSFTVPMVEWIDAGGTIRYRVLMDYELGLLADENGSIIVFN